MKSHHNSPRDRKRQYDVEHFIREWRMYRGLTVDGLAEQAGCSGSLVSQLERGKAQFTQPTLRLLADALNVRPWQLLAAAPGDGRLIWQNLAAIDLWAELPDDKQEAFSRMLDDNCDAAIRTAKALFLVEVKPAKK